MTGTECLSPLVVRRIIQVAGEDVMSSLAAVCLVDRAVYKLSWTDPEGDAFEHMESEVEMYEDEILERKQTRTDHTDSAVETDRVQKPTGQKLVEALEKEVYDSD
jgi:phenolic acid decarboxylase